MSRLLDSSISQEVQLYMSQPSAVVVTSDVVVVPSLDVPVTVVVASVVVVAENSLQSSTSTPSAGPDTQYGQTSSPSQCSRSQQIPSWPREGYQVNHLQSGLVEHED